MGGLCKRVALVTSQNWPNLCSKEDTGDHLLAAQLMANEIETSITIWDDPSVNWTQFDCVVLRSPWDYSSKMAEFKSWLERLKREGVRVWNPVDVILWNMDKSYLKDLEEEGVRIPKSVFVSGGSMFNIKEIMGDKGWECCLVKPTIGSGSRGVYFIQNIDQGIEIQGELEKVFSGRDFIVQEYLEEISSGEWSLCYFGNTFSHAVLAMPNNGYFLIRNKSYEFKSCEPPASVIEAGNKVISSLVKGGQKNELMYGRVDLVQRENGDVILIELELFEPSLYLSAHPLAPQHFSDQIIKKLAFSTE